MCFNEIIKNIDALEQITNKQVDRTMLKELVLSCPIDLKIPMMIDSAKQV